MKITTNALLLFFSLLYLAAANFDIYYGKEVYALDGSVYEIWSVFPAEPSCKDVLNYPVSFWPDDDDVSGDKTGVRCATNQDCASNKPERIDVLEMNFHAKNPIYHWTIYKDKNHDMYGLDGSIAGKCIVFPGDGFQCNRPTSSIDGVRKFRCLTEFTAQQLIDARKHGLELAVALGNRTDT